MQRRRDFELLWAAQAVSAFGSRVTRTALPVIGIVLLAAGPVELAALSSLEILPVVAVGMLGGGAIDRATKRSVLIAADAARAIVVVSIPLATWLGWLSIWQVYAAAAVVGGCSAAFKLADNAYLPALLRRDELVAGNSKLETTESIAEIGGPGLAGVLIQALGAPAALLLDALSYVGSAVLLSRIETVEHAAPRAEHSSSFCEDLRIGFRAGFGHPSIRATFFALGWQELFGGFFLTLYMLYALEVLGVSVASIGIIIGLGGVGALIGALLAEPLAKRLGLGRTMLLSLALGQAAALLIPLADAVPRGSPFLLATHQVLGDAFLVVFIVLATSLRQATLPRGASARANGLLHAAGGLLLPIGAFSAAAIASVGSVSLAVWVGVIGGLAAPLPLLRSAILGLEALPASEEHRAALN